jgi:hypothetical protein
VEEHELLAVRAVFVSLVCMGNESHIRVQIIDILAKTVPLRQHGGSNESGSGGAGGLSMAEHVAMMAHEKAPEMAKCAQRTSHRGWATRFLQPARLSKLWQKQPNAGLTNGRRMVLRLL